MHYWKGLALVLSIGISHIALGSPALQVTNPATLTTAGNGTRWEAGFTFGQIDNNFRRASTVGVAAAGNYDADPERPILPFFAISHAYSEKVSLGVALDVSNYLDVTWPDHTFDVNFGGQAVDLVTRGKLIATRLGPAVGIRIDQRWSTGARVFLQRVEALEDTGFAKAEGDGTTVGAQLGVRYIGRGYLVGAAFTTRRRRVHHSHQHRGTRLADQCPPAGGRERDTHRGGRKGGYFAPRPGAHELRIRLPARSVG